MAIIEKVRIFAAININIMERKYQTTEKGSSKVCESVAEYGTATKKRLRVFSREEIDHCMPLEESERLISEKIYKFYHPEA